MIGDCSSLSSMERKWVEQGEASMAPPSNEKFGATPLPDDVDDDDDNNFRPSVLTPIHEVPTRSRLHTAETDLIQNFNKTRTAAMAAATSTTSRLAISRAEDDFARDDVSSVVSSLSKDDSLLARPPIITASNSTGATTPPTEVTIRCEHDASSPIEMMAPDWLSLQQSLSSDLIKPSLSRDASAPAILMSSTWKRPGPRVRTVLASPKILRPSHGRHHSSPRMDFSVTSSAMDSASASSLDALFSDETAGSLSPDSFRLVGNRKMRTQVKSGTTSGHSSLTTVPTVASSSTNTNEEDSVASFRVRSIRKRNVVKEELKYVMNLVSTPIKKLPLLKKVADPQQNVDLTRADGCLT